MNRSTGTLRTDYPCEHPGCDATFTSPTSHARIHHIGTHAVFDADDPYGPGWGWFPIPGWLKR